MSTDVNQTTEDNVPSPEMPTGSLSEGTTEQTVDQVKKVAAQVFDKMGEAPEYLLEIFGEYKRPLTVIGLVLGALIAVKMTFAILGAINDIPVLAPVFELVGLGYTAWFIYRYLWKANSRKELVETLDSAKNQVIGKDS